MPSAAPIFQFSVTGTKQFFLALLPHLVHIHCSAMAISAAINIYVHTCILCTVMQVVINSVIWPSIIHV